MGRSTNRTSTPQSAGAGIDKFLLVARAAAVAVSGVTDIFRIEPSSGLILPPVMLAVLLLYSFGAGTYGFTLRGRKEKGPKTILIADLIVISIIVGISGGYNSPYFAMLLFLIVEASVCLNWRTGAAVIVTINGAQVVVTVIYLAAQGASSSYYPVESRFLLMLVVGLLLVILAESMRREGRARNTADRTSLRVTTLNSIFSQMGNAHLDLSRVFETVFAAADTVDAVLFAAILQRSRPDGEWTVAASSKSDLCSSGRNVFERVPSAQEETDALEPRIVTGEALDACAPCARSIGCNQLIMCLMPAYSPTEEGMLIVARRQGPSLDPDEAAFLRTLSMQAQLAIHNALLYRRQEQQFERLKIFNATQDAFFTAAAHDLKTPLTVLGVLTSTLRMTIPQPSTQQEEMLQTLEQNIRRLQRHTENMLAAARLEADDVVLRLRAIDPRRVALRSVEALASPLRDKDVRVVLQPESPWPRVTADPDRLGEMFGNLLSNAVKFAPRGSRVTIDLSFHEQDDVFSVCNAGSTVAESERERIFEKAYTGKHAGARAGSGLGLYIVRKLVALHGGRTWVDVSADSVCFRFSLPHRREEEDAGDDWSADEDTSDR